MLKTFLRGLLISIWILLLESSAFAAVNFPGWRRIVIGSVASLQYPQTIEIQNDNYRKISGKPSPKYNNIILQQKGLNKMTPDGRSRYARVLFETNKSELGVHLYDKLVFTKSELKEFDEIVYKKIVQEGILLNNRILARKPLQVININGVDCLYHSYARQMSNQPVVIVHSFVFFNNQYIHKLTISYRDSEKSYWNAPGYDIRRIVQTLDIKAQ